MLSDPVAEAFGLIHRHPSGENLWYGMGLVLIAIMKLFERVIEKRLRKHLEDNVSLVNTSQALGNPSQQMTIFFVSPRPSWKASIGENM